ncbi:hypothetical protein PY650_14195 [Rhizobium calliandrae]|uniref:Uncharacterized protein n=1 Tax=Rhizobium calliandrae TaxID=1312182 RepID=A0ABT7KDV1_9HYPH|nr:hypothetical protein [Rhizobium calliandrae]MDL2406791.1 hypothetical protein [Rhizobium calliandrae]
MQAHFSEAAGRQIPDSRFVQEVLAANLFLQKLTALVDDGRLSGNADLDALRQMNPEMLSLKSWWSGAHRQTIPNLLETFLHQPFIHSVIAISDK